MKKLAIVLLALMLGGCGTTNYLHWSELTDREKQTVIISGTILVAAAIIANSQETTVNNCISTRSLETGCHPK